MKILIFTMLLLGVCSARGQTKITEYEYISLPYELDALEPAISRRTMALHYGQHLHSYVENLNRLIKGTALEGETLEDYLNKYVFAGVKGTTLAPMLGRRLTIISTSCNSHPRAGENHQARSSVLSSTAGVPLRTSDSQWRRQRAHFSDQGGCGWLQMWQEICIYYKSPTHRTPCDMNCSHCSVLMCGNTHTTLITKIDEGIIYMPYGR